MHNVSTSKEAHAFLFEDGQDHLGWRRQEYLDASDLDWEQNHDMIQWWFPTWEPSKFNPYAPVVPVNVLREWGTDQSKQAVVLENVQRFLAFLGFTLDLENVQIQDAQDNTWQLENWLYVPTHNDLRITRMLEHMHAMNLQEQAKMVYHHLHDRVLQDREKVNHETMTFWKNAAFGLPKPEFPSRWNTTFTIDDLDNIV